MPTALFPSEIMLRGAANYHFVGGLASWRENQPVAGLGKRSVLGFKCAESGVGSAVSLRPRKVHALVRMIFNVGPARV